MGFSINYTGKSQKWSAAVKLVKEGRASIFVLLVKERRRNADDLSYTYGFFLRNDAGEVVDVVRQSTADLRTIHSADNVVSALFEVYEGLIKEFVIPAKCEDNLVFPNEIDKVELPELAYTRIDLDKRQVVRDLP